jgi:hypothetical protein
MMYMIIYGQQNEIGWPQKTEKFPLKKHFLLKVFLLTTVTKRNIFFKTFFPNGFGVITISKTIFPSDFQLTTVSKVFSLIFTNGF